MPAMRPVAHGEAEDRHGSATDRHHRSGQAVDQRQPGGLRPTGEDSSDRIDAAHLLAQLRGAGARSGGGHLDRHGVGPHHHVGVEQS